MTLLNNSIKTGTKLDFMNFKNNPGLKDFAQKLNSLLEGLAFTGRTDAMGTALEYALLAADDGVNDYINRVSDNLIKQVTGKAYNTKVTYSGINPHNQELWKEIEKSTGFGSDKLKIDMGGGTVSESSKYKMDV